MLHRKPPTLAPSGRCWLDNKFIKWEQVELKMHEVVNPGCSTRTVVLGGYKADPSPFIRMLLITSTSRFHPAL